MSNLSGSNPEQARDQQRAFQWLGARSAREGNSLSAKKLLAILIPVFVIVLAIVLLCSGVLERGYMVRFDGALYVSTQQVFYELPEGYSLAGELVLVDNPRRSEENFASNWTLPAKLYINPADNRFAYISYLSDFGNYLQLKRRG